MQAAENRDAGEASGARSWGSGSFRNEVGFYVAAQPDDRIPIAGYFTVTIDLDGFARTYVAGAAERESERGRGSADGGWVLGGDFGDVVDFDPSPDKDEIGEGRKFRHLRRAPRSTGSHVFVPSAAFTCETHPRGRGILRLRGALSEAAETGGCIDLDFGALDPGEHQTIRLLRLCACLRGLARA